MTHKLRVEYRTLEGLLSSTAGGAVIGAVVEKSWLLGVAALVLAVILVLVERLDLTGEETTDSDVLVLDKNMVTALRNSANRELKEIKDGESLSYLDGLYDGNTMTSQFVLGQFEDTKKNG